MDTLRLVSVHHQSNVIVLMFLPGTLPDCDIRRVVTCSLTVLDEALLKLAEEFVAIRIIVILRKSDIIPHEEDLAVTIAHVGHQLIDLLQYRFFTSELSGFIRHDGMALVLVFVGDSFVSHVAFFHVLIMEVYHLFCSFCIEVSPMVSSKPSPWGLYRYYHLPVLERVKLACRTDSFDP